VELWYCRKYMRLAEAQGILAEVKEKYSDHLARCQRILEKPPSYWRSNPILELIAQGESHTLEFKETLEYSINTRQRNTDVLKSSLKTITGFLNADGGTLLIGVSDSGEVKGITRDLQFVRGNNQDGFEQKLRSLINDHFDPSPLGNVMITFEDLQEGTVCQIVVEPSSEPVAYDNDFYIRDGNGTRKLEGRDLADWIQRRTQQSSIPGNEAD
ncbi:MAG: helix-turn-helix domain-containing protein, partial [Candidatus Hodarchaeota archaeon]